MGQISFLSAAKLALDIQRINPLSNAGRISRWPTASIGWASDVDHAVAAWSLWENAIG
jgi:hypothetical protein